MPKFHPNFLLYLERTARPLQEREGDEVAMHIQSEQLLRIGENGKPDPSRSVSMGCYVQHGEKVYVLSAFPIGCTDNGSRAGEINRGMPSNMTVNGPRPAFERGIIRLISHELHYVLIELHNRDDWKDSWICAQTRPEPSYVVRETLEAIEDVNIAVAGRHLTGKLLASPTSPQAPIDSHLIQLDKPYNPVDIGAMVIDPASGGLCGHIIGGCVTNWRTYMVPAHAVFDDLERQLGDEIFLVAARAMVPLDHNGQWVEWVSSMPGRGPTTWTAPAEEYQREMEIQRQMGSGR